MGKVLRQCQLCASYEISLADDRLTPILSKALGKQFFKKKKQPIPIRIFRSNNWVEEINKALSRTFLFLNSGTCLSIKVGRSHQACKQLLENIIATVEQLAGLVPGKWSNLQGIFIRTTQSISLPVYQNLPLCSKIISK